MTKNKVDISKISQLEKFTKLFANQVNGICWIYLNGNLGSGKTTFAQKFIAAKGYKGIIASPTYSIMQDYVTNNNFIIHCDLYRLSEPEELYEIGLIDLAEEKKAIVLIEWPIKGKKILPNPDIQIDFSLDKNSRAINITSN